MLKCHDLSLGCRFRSLRSPMHLERNKAISSHAVCAFPLGIRALHHIADMVKSMLVSMSVPGLTEDSGWTKARGRDRHEDTVMAETIGSASHTAYDY